MTQGAPFSLPNLVGARVGASGEWVNCDYALITLSEWRAILNNYYVLEIKTFGLGSRTRDVCS